MSSMVILLGLLAIFVVLVLWLVGIFNALVQLRNRVKNAWSQIDVQLKRRHDLIPNLVEVVKDYMSYEKDTLEAVIKARSGAVAAQEGGDRAAQIAAREARKFLADKTSIDRIIFVCFDQETEDHYKSALPDIV